MDATAFSIRSPATDARFTSHEAIPAAEEVRLAEFRGEEYLVAPVVLVREGVLNGGFLPAEEIQASVPGWNGVPVTAPPSPDESGHPTEDGEFISANTPEIFEEYVIGQVFNVKYDDENDSLLGEMWVNLTRAEAVGKAAVEVVERLAKGDTLEVSTGYWHGWEERHGTHHGESYEEIQFDLLPDHLAALPYETGACSWEDGCGAPRVNQFLSHTMDNTPTGDTPAPGYVGGANANASPRTPEYSGTNAASLDSWSEVDLTFEAFVAAYADDNPDATEWDQLAADERTAIAQRSLNGDPRANDFDEGLVLPVVDPATDELHEGGLLAALSRAPQTDGINVEETQTRIRSLLEDEFDRDMEENATPDGTTDSTGNSLQQRVKHAVHLLTGADCDCDTPNPAFDADETKGAGTNPTTTDTDSDSDTDTTTNMDNIDYERLAEISSWSEEDLRDDDDLAQNLAEAINNVSDSADDDGDGGGDGQTTDGNADDPDGGSADDPTDDDSPENQTVELTAEEIQEMVDERVEERLESAQNAERKADLIDTITTHTERTADDLDGMEVDSLEILAEMAESQADDGDDSDGSFDLGANYAGRGTPQSRASSDDEGDFGAVGGLAALAERDREKEAGD